MDFHQLLDQNLICPVFVADPTLCVFAQISYFKSRDLS